MNAHAANGAPRQGGAVMILYAMALVMILGFAGLVLDLGMAYARMARMQSTADHAAMAAAMALDGTAAGVAAAATSAADRWRVRWGGPGATWVPDALRFSSDPNAGDAGWLSISAATAAPATMLYARVDTGMLGASVRLIQPTLMRVLGVTTPIDVRPRSIAGRRRLRILPLAICAMGQETSTRGAGANAELVNYGFRHGVTYNLLMLNTTGAPAGEYFYVNPLAAGTAGDPAALTNEAVAPFMCSGTVAYPRIPNGTVHVRRVDAFTLWNQLNSRFEDYLGANTCTKLNGQADTNIRSYVGANVLSWQGPAVPRASALSKVVDGKLATIADQWPAQTYPPAEYGTRWAYGPAKNPDGTAKLMSSWATLYPSSPAATYVQMASPYRSRTTPAVDMDSAQGSRRMLYVPLLQCPVPAGQYAQATILAYGRFLLTARASAGELPAEFAGFLPLASEARLTDEAELLQ